MSSNPTQAEIKLVTFLLNGQEYAVNVKYVREIISMTPITKAANSRYNLEGMINLRGSIVPVVSLRKCFGLTELEDLSSCCIAVMDFAGKPAGFIIDEVADVIQVRPEEVEPPFDNAMEEWLQGILNLEDKLVVVMNLQPLAEA